MASRSAMIPQLSWRLVYFRENLHDGPHERLVDEKLFSRVQALLSERGEDYSKRASATSEF
ncbi:MAG: hypothetical protein ACRDYZ_04430, partial [Acidimicrobiales bacterium]